MSKDKAEEKAREYAGITPDVNNIDQLPNQFVFVKEKYFSFVAGYTQAVTDLSTENSQLREALREILIGIEGLPPLRAIEGALEKQYIKAKQLLTDKE